ncbi:MAG: hypothetical protein AAB865_02625 [Patescibacteria group bacterium]
MYLHGSEVFFEDTSEQPQSSMTTTVGQGPSFFVGVRSSMSVIQDSLMVILFVAAAALVLAGVEGVVESHHPEVVQAAE